MKIFSVLLILVFISCSGGSNESQEMETATAEVVEPAPIEVSAVCIWDKVSVRETPESKGKWITSISVGEMLTFLGSEAIDSLDKNRRYLNVKLADGTEGWSVSDFIIPEGKVAAFLEEANVYKRPDLLTKTENKFSRMDIVAIKSSQDDWFEVVGKRSEGKWIETGWIKNSNISENSIDVAVAKFGKLAINAEDEEAQREGLEEILENSDFSNSAFIPMIQEVYDEIMMPEIELEEVDSTSVSE